MLVATYVQGSPRQPEAVDLREGLPHVEARPQPNCRKAINSVVRHKGTKAKEHTSSRLPAAMKGPNQLVLMAVVAS